MYCPPTRRVQVVAEDPRSSLHGIAYPTCREHAPAVKEVVKAMCLGAAVAVEIIPLRKQQDPDVLRTHESRIVNTRMRTSPF